MRWLLYVAVVAGVFVSSAIAATTVTLLVADGEPRDRYVVTVYLKNEVTDADRTTLRSELSRLYPRDRVQLDSPERTAERYRELRGDESGSSDESIKVESFRVEIGGPSPDCAALAPVKQMAGVGLVTVVQPPGEGSTHALLLACP
ncbi:permease-like cell division protein FtsX [Micromonospora sp. CPCC 205371]|nr:permease-like cell division protein FtsX [Micromonospora sp. CPCC 205371]